MAALLESRYAHCEPVTLVLDNLNTHVAAAPYEALGAGEQLLDRIEFRYTPKHGRWLNMAECELSCLIRQCLRGRRIGKLEQLRSETAA